MSSKQKTSAKQGGQEKAAAAVSSRRKSGAHDAPTADWETQATKPKRVSKTGAKLPGDKGNPGRPLGSKSSITEAKRKFISSTGQTPLDFLTAVYRNELYDEYEVEAVDPKRGVYHVYPKLDPITGEVVAKKLTVDLQQRIQAATSAAPYVHRKKPIGIDGGEGGKPVSFVSAAQLAQLSDEELDKLLLVLGKLNVAGEFEGAGVATPGLEDGDD